MEFVLARLKVSCTLFSAFLVLTCFGVFRSAAQPLLPVKEVETLKQISSKMKNGYWENVSRFSCNEPSGAFNLSNMNGGKGLSNVTCNCSFNGATECHITNIQLKRLNLSGVLPEELGDLRYLKEIDLAFNYLNGSIPKSLAQLPLVTLTLMGNRFNGTIPIEIGDIATLENLILEQNQFEGPIPGELGKLSNLGRFCISANKFTGPIPDTFSNLTNLTEFKIDGNAISGKIPSFIGNWTKIKELHMQGTSMEGPFPSTFSLLKNLIQLRVSDLNASNLNFPPLNDTKTLEILALRNCSITGSIPAFNWKEMRLIKVLDLSFNRLVGEIPDSLSNIDTIYLNDNLLNGTILSWITEGQNNN